MLVRKKPVREPVDTNGREMQKAHGQTDYALLAGFRYHLRVFLAFSDTNAKSAGLTSQQYQVLLTIEGFSGDRPMSVGELAKFMLIKHHSAVELVARMTRSGLLQKTIGADDKRRVTVTLTKLGQLRLNKVAAENFRHLGSSSPTFLKVLKSIRSQK